MPREPKRPALPPAAAARLRAEAAPAPGPLLLRVGRARYEWEEMVPEVLASGDGYAFVRLPAFTGIVALNEALKTAARVPDDEIEEALTHFKRAPKPVEPAPEVPEELRAMIAALPEGYRLAVDPATGEPKLVKIRPRKAGPANAEAEPSPKPPRRKRA